MSEPPDTTLIPISQNDSGRAFEYGIAMSFVRLLAASPDLTPEMRRAKTSFESVSDREQVKIAKAADEIVMFLIAHDNRFVGNGWNVMIQSDQQGRLGDVRDVIVYKSTLKSGIGISAKNRHSAVKHSRLSVQLDFGTDWLNLRCSNNYFHQVAPLFGELNSRRTRGEMWRNIPDKKTRFYLPILLAFQTEMAALFAAHPNVAPKALVQYLLGRHDYYKVIKENGTVSVVSFNISGSLKWGGRMPLPTSITAISMKPKSQTTLNMVFDKGWSLSFRIHNASTLVEPSLKFDINIVGMPMPASRHEINYI